MLKYLGVEVHGKGHVYKNNVEARYILRLMNREILPVPYLKLTKKSVHNALKRTH